MQVEGKNYYELLGVSRDASQADIAAAYKELARIFHPDSNYYSDIIASPVSDEECEVFKLITSAYDTLRNQETRSRYDQTLLSGTIPQWGEDDWGKSKREEAPLIYQAMTNGPRKFRSPTRGFGSVRHKASYPDLDQQIRPVSEVIHLKRGLLGRIWRFLKF